jgi:hypothetical protein
MNKSLWNEQIQNSVLAYINSTNPIEKNKIYTKDLFPVIKNYVDIVIKQTGVEYNDEHKQELFIKSLEILDKIKVENIGTAQEYIYRALFNTALSFYRIPKKIPYFEDYTQCNNLYEDVYEYEQDEIRKEIMTELNRKINQFKVFNKTNVVFLLLLKEYIIENDFDYRGFDVYIMDRMNISINQFRNLACSLHIKTKILREKLIND